MADSDHVFVVRSEDTGALAWQLPGDLSAAIDLIAEQNPLLAETIVLSIRNSLSQIADILMKSLRSGTGNENYLNILAMSLGHIRERIDFFITHPHFALFKFDGGHHE